MPYQFDCECGKKISAEVWQCGTEVTCATCGRKAIVPELTILKELSGDKYPLLTPLQKIVRTSQNAEPPFDGKCHGCSSADAEMMIPVTFNVMQERSVDDNVAIRPTLTGVQLVAGGGTETWRYVTFPLLLCANCYPECSKSIRKAKLRKLTGNLFVLLLLVGFLWFAYAYTELIAALACVFSFVGAIAWMLSHRRKSRVDPRIMAWLEKIRWVPDAISSEEEFRIHVGKARPLPAKAHVGPPPSG